MKKNSKYTKSFMSNGLTDAKYDDINKLAHDICDDKNLVSIEVANNLNFYMEMPEMVFRSYMENKYKHLNISSNFYKAIYQHIYTCYDNKFKAIKLKMRFEKVELKSIEYYKRNTKYNKEGDFKKLNNVRSSTNLTKVLSFLARYGNETTLDYVLNEVMKDNEKKEFYQMVIHYSNKFGFNRLLKLALLKRENIINRYNTPVEFTSLSFRGRSRKKDIISYNKNKGSVNKAFISLSWLKSGQSMDIPVKYSKNFYGDIKKYSKKSADYEYTITFTRDKKVCVNICIDGVRDIPVSSEDIDKFIGIDVNVKHNLFTLSDDSKPFDFDRKQMTKICSELSKINELKKKDKEYKVGKKRQRKIDSMRNVFKHSTEFMISEVCKYFVEKGYDHAIFENLNNGFGKNYGKMNDINFNRVVKELKLSSLKNMFESIGRKYGIAYSTIHAEYTSKMCSACGCIHDENRLSQEEFKCVECGYTDNADNNAAKNIRNRVVLTVLRNLLKQDVDLKTFSPKKLSRDSVKKFLMKTLSF